MNATSLSQVHGFNYQPSYGTSGLELWQKFDPTTIHVELGQGKKFFPKMNAIRLWLSWEAFKRNPAKFTDDFDHALVIAADYDLRVMPCAPQPDRRFASAGVWASRLPGKSRVH